MLRRSGIEAADEEFHLTPAEGPLIGRVGLDASGTGPESLTVRQDMGTATSRELLEGGATPFPVLAFGAGVTLLGVIRTFARAGVPVYVASRTEGLVTRSRWFRPTPVTLAESTDPDALARFLAKLPFPGGVLVPCSDVWTIAVANLPRDLAARFPSSTAEPRVQQALVDKAGLRRELDRLGLPHPRTMEIHSREDLEGLGPEAFEGTFLKPRNSQAFFARYGVKAVMCRDKADAVETWSAAAAEGLEMLLQEYVPGPPDRHFFIDGFVDRDHRVRGRFARQRLRMNPPDFGCSSCFVSVPLRDVAPALGSVETLLDRIRYRGIFSVEFKRDPRDGVFKMLDFNARPWWYVAFAAECGVDVCRMAYDDAMGRDVAESARYVEGRSCIFAELDWERCRELHRQGSLTYLEWARSWARSAHPIFAWDDPAPAAIDLLHQMPRVLRYALRTTKRAVSVRSR